MAEVFTMNLNPGGDSSVFIPESPGEYTKKMTLHTADTYVDRDIEIKSSMFIREAEVDASKSNMQLLGGTNVQAHSEGMTLLTEEPEYEHLILNVSGTFNGQIKGTNVIDVNKSGWINEGSIVNEIDQNIDTIVNNRTYFIPKGTKNVTLSQHTIINPEIEENVNINVSNVNYSSNGIKDEIPDVPYLEINSSVQTTPGLSSAEAVATSTEGYIEEDLEGIKTDISAKQINVNKIKTNNKYIEIYLGNLKQQIFNLK